MIPVPFVHVKYYVYRYSDGKYIFVVLSNFLCLSNQLFEIGPWARFHKKIAKIDLNCQSIINAKQSVVSLKAIGHFR